MTYYILIKPPLNIMSPLSIGNPMIRFSLPNQDNKIVDLTDFKGKWLVLFAYPKDNTPGCTTEAVNFSNTIKEFQSLNAEVVGVSPDSSKSHQTFIKNKNLKISLLSDTNKDFLKQCNIWVEKSMFGKKYMGVERTTFLVDPNNIITYIWNKVTVKGHDRAVINKIKEII